MQGPVSGRASRQNPQIPTAPGLPRRWRLGRPAAPGVPPAWALLVSQADARCRARRYRRWMEKRAAA